MLNMFCKDCESHLEKCKCTEITLNGLSYKLIRERDGLEVISPPFSKINWLEFNEDGNELFDEIKVGRSLLIPTQRFGQLWQTTSVTEIIEQKEDYVKFQTENSVYELFTLKN
jgi:hypothetical protein